MSRMVRRRSLTTAAAATAAALVLPAAAHAVATYTVTPGNGPCGAPADLICGNLVEATTAAATGDTFNILPSTTPYEAVEWTKGGLTINGAAGVAVNGTMTFSADSGGVSKLSKVGISQGTAAGPGIVVDGVSGLELSDSIVLSKGGHGVLIRAGRTNKIVRSFVVTGGGSASAVRIESTKGTPNNVLNKRLTLESTLLTGGGSGLGVFTIADLLSPAGNVEVIARHITAAGSTNGIVLDSSATGTLGAVGNITATLGDSIALNNRTKRNELFGSAADIDADTRSLQTGDPNTLFADPISSNYRLRPGSPAIDQGGFTDGESATDIDGEPRPGPTTDLGADEFVNAAPTASVKVATAKPRNGQPVTFDGRGSSDREASYGGGIVKYQWSFGDGQTQETTTPTVQHTYGATGSTAVQLVVVDNFGLASAAASAPLTISDGTPPEVKITKPFRNQKLKLVTVRKKTVTTKGKKRTKTTRKKLRLSFAGSAKDSSGVANVVLFVEKLAAPSAKASQTAKPSQCTWLDPKRGLIKRSCAKPIFIPARLAKDGSWTYNLSTKIKQPSAGSYRVIASGLDATGAAGNSASSKDAIIRFTLAK
jgi:hypothetical protein